MQCLAQGSFTQFVAHTLHVVPGAKGHDLGQKVREIVERLVGRFPPDKAASDLLKFLAKLGTHKLIMIIRAFPLSDKFGSSSLEVKDHMVFGGASPIVAEGVGFRAPKSEAGAFVKTLGVRRGGTDAEADGGDARQRACVLEGGVQ